MSPAFQESLTGNELLLNSQEIRYYDTITLKHKDTKVYLHSHLESYPLRYDDGRISSQGMCSPFHLIELRLNVLPQVNKLLATLITTPTTTGRSSPRRLSQQLAVAVSFAIKTRSNSCTSRPRVTC